MSRLLHVAVLLTAACSARGGQVLLYVGTDAPLPPPAGEARGHNEPPPLFDSVRVDLLLADEDTPCTGCSRTFELDREKARAGASLGVAIPFEASGYRVRVRMFRAIALMGSEPPPGAALDTTVMLPQLAEGEMIELTAFLPTDSLDAPSGIAELPSEPLEGPPDPSLVGSWSGARLVPCSAPPPAGMVCVPGGAFWMGHPFAALDLGAPGTAANEQRIVVLSPFYLDAMEVTVAQLRAAGVAVHDPESGKSVSPVEHSGTPNGDAYEDWCTYSREPGPYESHPVNCVGWEEARAYCRSRGADLPTEAQREYVGGKLESALFVWGEDEPSCGDAVWGGGGVGILTGSTNSCPADAGIGGPKPGGRGSRDRLELPTGTIFDLAGNVTEWVLDAWNRQGEPCWPTGILFDPLCDQPSPRDGAGRSERGGNWVLGTGYLRAANRFRGRPWDRPPNNGFRCAMPAGEHDG